MAHAHACANAADTGADRIADTNADACADACSWHCAARLNVSDRRANADPNSGAYSGATHTNTNTGTNARPNACYLRVGRVQIRGNGHWHMRSVPAGQVQRHPFSHRHVLQGVRPGPLHSRNPQGLLHALPSGQALTCGDTAQCMPGVRARARAAKCRRGRVQPVQRRAVRRAPTPSSRRAETVHALSSWKEQSWSGAVRMRRNRSHATPNAKPHTRPNTEA